MKFQILAIACLSIFSSLAIAKEESKKNQLIGLWLSEDKDHFFSFEADGTYRVIGEEMELKGTWKQDPDKGQIHITMTLFGQTKTSTMEAKYDGAGKVDFIVEGEAQAYTRPVTEFDRNKMVGSWKYTVKQPELGILSHCIAKYEESGKASYKSLDISEKHKMHCLNEGRFQWRVDSGYLVEFADAGTEDETTSIYTVESVAPDKLVIQYVFDEERLDMTPTKDDTLPAPPEGYKKVTFEKFWETLEADFEEEVEDEDEE